MRKKASLKITLKSDLCVGSGYSYAGVVDSDVTSDRYGFPYIPARRLKGCMRESAEMIDLALKNSDTIKELFGERGQKESGKLFVENAYIKPESKSDYLKNIIQEYDRLADEIGIHRFEKKYSKETILQQFTSIRSQTRIDDKGIADDNSLRFIRVVNRISPLSNIDEPAELCFYSNVSFPAEYEDDLIKIAQATRFIGLNRNRGLGNVACELINISEVSRETVTCSNDSGTTEIRYILTNESPLMISQESDNVSESYIPGRMILGSLANRYLSEQGHSPSDKAFRDLFLNGSVTQFQNAYIADENESRCIPVPGYINRLKKSKKLVNIEKLYDSPDEKDCRPIEDLPSEDQQYAKTGGNQPKKLSGKYCTIDKNHSIKIKETKLQLTYHHRHKHGDEDVQLYSHLAIAEDQRFIGVIRTSSSYSDLLISLLESGLTIGKSKNAQYGKCTIKIINSKEESSNDLLSLHAGDDILLSLSSPAIFTDNGRELTAYSDIRQKIAENLDIADKIDESMQETDGKNPFGIFNTKLIYGYQSVWNLRRTPVPAVSEGSVFVYHLNQDCKIHQNAMIGERQIEGYGEIHIEKFSDLGYRLISGDEKAGETNDVRKTSENNDSKSGALTIPELLKPLTDRIDLEQKLETELEKVYKDNIQKFLNRLSASALGGITLMLRESRAYNDNYQKQYDNFINRIKSIKTASVKDSALSYTDKCSPEKLEDSLKDKWYEIALAGLTYQKYLKKQKGGE